MREVDDPVVGLKGRGQETVVFNDHRLHRVFGRHEQGACARDIHRGDVVETALGSTEAAPTLVQPARRFGLHHRRTFRSAWAVASGSSNCRPLGTMTVPDATDDPSPLPAVRKTPGAPCRRNTPCDAPVSLNSARYESHLSGDNPTFGRGQDTSSTSHVKSDAMRVSCESSSAMDARVTNARRKGRAPCRYANPPGEPRERRWRRERPVRTGAPTGSGTCACAP